MSNDDKTSPPAAPASNFLRAIIDSDLKEGAYQRPGLPNVITRFPPEPNGYLHIGHAKSICLNFGLARDYAGRCHLRFDDTNPEKEDQEYVDTIMDSVKWLGFDWKQNDVEHLHYASDYFEQLYKMAEYLIEAGHAYVDSQSADEMKAGRGDFSTPGTNSPYRERAASESLDLFRRMKAGEFKDGEHIVRAKIDMASPNMNLRDPAIYRIRHAHHHRTGDAWCIYPMYDYTHPLSDAIEQITHSICTLEFQDHRPFYDWVIRQLIDFFAAKEYAEFLEIIKIQIEQNPALVLQAASDSWRVYRPYDENPFYQLAANIPLAKMEGMTADLNTGIINFLKILRSDNYFTLSYFSPKLPYLFSLITSDFDRTKALGKLPHQYEFARLNLTYVVTSKRKLRELVEENIVNGWDDPRMPTIVGIRRRGYTPEAIQLFCERIGVTRSDGWIDYSTLEGCLREDLDPKAPRATAVLRPLKLIIDNFPEGETVECTSPVHPHFPERGLRTFPISKELWIEQEDFMEVPSKGYFRLFPGNKVRLRYGYVVECTGCDKDAEGKVIAVHCTYFADSKSGTEGSANYKVKGNIHWVSAAHSLEAEVRLYDRLFTDANPDAGGKDFKQVLNPNSLEVVKAYLEPGMSAAKADERFQFERHGYFVADRVESVQGKPVFNRVTTLKDGWGK